MRAKLPTLFISFPSTTAAMEAEARFRAGGFPGRLVPVPREITAGCGLAWMSEPEEESRLLSFLRENGLLYEACAVLSYFR